jgi:hypothetical protein
MLVGGAIIYRLQIICSRRHKLRKDAILGSGPSQKILLIRASIEYGNAGDLLEEKSSSITTGLL